MNSFHQKLLGEKFRSLSLNPESLITYAAGTESSREHKKCMLLIDAGIYLQQIDSKGLIKPRPMGPSNFPLCLSVCDWECCRCDLMLQLLTH